MFCPFGWREEGCFLVVVFNITRILQDVHTKIEVRPQILIRGLQGILATQLILKCLLLIISENVYFVH